jgi:hypothetical protein
MDASEVSPDKISCEVIRALATNRFSNLDNLPVAVRDNLFIGSIGAANNKDAIVDNGIGYIISIGNGDRYSSITTDVVESLNITHLLIEIEDKSSSDLSSRIEECVDFITRAFSNNGKVLVHCFQGKSRSAGNISLEC